MSFIRRFLGLGLLCGLLLSIAPGLAQDPTAPAPTLVPPTRVPTQPAQAADQPADYSGVATMVNEGVLRIGTRYNERPFSYLDENGDLTGYEVELMESLGVQLGVQVEWVQVTAETEREDLHFGRVDALIGQQLHSRDAAQYYDFSHPYYLNQQRMVVREDTPFSNFDGLRDQPISVVQYSPADAALPAYAQYNWNVQYFFTQGQALDALAEGSVEAMIGELDDLSRAGRQGMRFIEQPIQLDPYAIAVRPYDVNLRNALNRGLQRLLASGEVDRIYDNWFSNKPDNLFDVLMPIYENLFEDSRNATDFPTDIPRPEESLLDTVLAGGSLNVAGLSLNPDASLFERLLDPFNQALMNEIAQRWGVTLNYIPNSANGAVEYLVRGEADIALGVLPRWDGADRFDYSRPYAIAGDRVMVLEGSRYQAFNDFRGGSYMGYWYEDASDRSRIEQIAEAVRVNTTIYEFRSMREITDQFINRNVDGIFGDIRRLRTIQEETRTSGLPWQILDETYSETPITIALPRNDRRFRLLLNWTLQDMFLDGTYQRLYNDTYGEGEPLIMLTYPGDGSWLLEAP